MEKLLLRPEEAALMLGLSRTTLYALLSRGEIASVRVGRSRRIARTELLRWLGSMPNATGTPPALN